MIFLTLGYAVALTVPGCSLTGQGRWMVDPRGPVEFRGTGGPSTTTGGMSGPFDTRGAPSVDESEGDTLTASSSPRIQRVQSIGCIVFLGRVA